MRKSYMPAAARMAAAIRQAGEYLDDQQAANVPALFMPWDAMAHYETGNRVRYGGLLYRCLQAHDAQASWTPDTAPSLWVRVDDPAVEWPDWRQPLGAHDAYALGAKVTHKGKHFISTTGGNVWEPGSYGWEAVL